MKKSWVTFLLSALCAAVGAAEINNGNFSRNTEGWTVDRKVNRQDAIGVDTAQGVAAPGALRLRSGCGLYQDVKLEPDTEYVFSCYFRTRECTPPNDRDVKKWGGGADIALRGVSPDGQTRWVFGTGRKYLGNTEWTKFERKFNSKQIPGGTLRIILSLEGTVWNGELLVDDVKLEKTAPAAEVSVRLLPIEFQQQAYFVCENMPGLPRIDLAGDAAQWSAAGITVHLQLPAGFRLLGVAGERSNEAAPLPDMYEHHPAQEISPGVFEAPLPRRMLANLRKTNWNWDNCCFFILAANPGSAGRTGTARFKLRSGGKTLYQTEFKLTALPPVKLPETPVQYYTSGVVRPYSQRCGLPEVGDAYLKFWTALTGIRETETRAMKFYERERPEFYRQFRFICNSYGSTIGGLPLLAAGVLRHDPRWAQLPKFVDRDGKIDEQSLASWYVAEDPDGLVWEAFKTAVSPIFRQFPGKAVAYLDNFEPRYDGSYDPENLKRFAEYARLAKVPDRETVRSRYLAQYREFRFRQHAAIVRKCAQVIHENFPGVQYRICNEPLPADRGPRDIDPRQFDDPAVIECHAHMFYSIGTKFFDTVKLNSDTFRQPLQVLIDPTEDHILYYLRYTPAEVGRDIVAAAALGATGLLSYPGDDFDGRYLQPLADGFGTVGKLEKFYSTARSDFDASCAMRNVVTANFDDNGIRTTLTVPDMNEFIRMTRHTARDGEQLLTIFNYSAQNDAIFELKLPGGRRVLDDPIHQIAYADADTAAGALIRVPAGATGYFRLRRADAAVEADFTAIRQKQLAGMLEEAMQRLQATNQLKTSRRGDAEISFSQLPDTGKTPMLKLQAKHRRIYIDYLNGGEVIGWRGNESHSYDWLKAGRQRGFLGRVVYHEPSQDRKPPYAFVLTAMNYDEQGAPYAEFEYSVPQYGDLGIKANPLLGLYCRKRITLTDDGQSIDFKFHFENRNPLHLPMPLDCRIANAPLPGGRLLGEHDLPGPLTDIIYQADGQSRNIPVGVTDSLLVKTARAPLPFPATVVPGWDGSAIRLTATSGALSETLALIPATPGFAGAYCWRSPELSTVELLSATPALQAGKSIELGYRITARP